MVNKRVKDELDMQSDFADSVHAEEMDTIPAELYEEFEKQLKKHQNNKNDDFDWPDSTLADL